LHLNMLFEKKIKVYHLSNDNYFKSKNFKWQIWIQS